MFRKLQRQLDRRATGRAGSKFSFDVNVTSLDGIPPHLKLARFVWIRGAKEQHTEVAPVQTGIAVWKQKLTQRITLYKDSQKSGAWEPKECIFKELVSTHLREVSWAQCASFPLTLLTMLLQSTPRSISPCKSLCQQAIWQRPALWAAAIADLQPPPCVAWRG
ncbi:hypothetical protein WJX84_004834 [Apatococcus fuscideae]|uniref:C2 NT-type domain-containing protein n=1 Tax=Apatococcus fuscideae TaxID=2026836 RepID=A0AAW1S4W6_9CHLO